MGLFGNLFKTEEEKAAEQEQRRKAQEELEGRIQTSPMTLAIQEYLKNEFGELNSEQVSLLRKLAAGGGRAGYIMEVRYDGILFNLINRSGESLDKWGISFDALGCENLPSGGASVLQKILLATLSEIPHLMVLDTGFFMYNKDRAKSSW